MTEASGSSSGGMSTEHDLLAELVTQQLEAMLAVGNAHYWGNFGVPRDFERALRYYERAHNQGALLGTVGVAKMSLKGEGAPKNTTKAMDYYHAAANRSSPDALNGLGYLHFYGDEVERNLTTALSYFKRAAELGSGDGLVNAGLMLRGGMGSSSNKLSSLKALKR